MATGHQTTIVNLDRKLDAAMQAAAGNEVFSRRLLELIDQSAEPPVLMQKHLAEALGVGTSRISSVLPARRSTKKSLGQGRSQGFVISFAGVLGFGPDEQTLWELVESFQDAHRLKLGPQRLYDILGVWAAEGQTPAQHCWAAFSGESNDQSEIGKFAELYRNCVAELQPVRYGRNLWTPGFPNQPWAVSTARSAESTRKAHEIVALLDAKLPKTGHLDSGAHTKSALYGGGPTELSTMEHSVLAHAFPRQAMTDLAEEIRGVTDTFQIFTVRTDRGSGLSLALAQLARELAGTADSSVRWIIGNAERTKSFLLALADSDSRAALAEFLHYELREDETKRLSILIFDDVTLATPFQTAHLSRFCAACSDRFDESPHGRIVFVFGSFGDTGPFFGKCVPLSLTEKDRENCYRQMALSDPAILRPYPEDLKGLRSNFPEERLILDDVESFVDWLLEHGEPIFPSQGMGRASVRGLPADIELIVTAAATLQLVGLLLPWQVAARMLGTPDAAIREKLQQATRETDCLQEDHQKEWVGVKLACPRRAWSVLQGMEKSGYKDIEFMLLQVVGFALEIPHKAFRDPSPWNDYIRHILQRLFKPEVYRFPGKVLVASGLQEAFLDIASRGALQTTPDEWPEWAGTLSARLKTSVARRKNNSRDREDRERISRYVARLIYGSLDRIGGRIGGAVDGAKAVVIMRASRLLLASERNIPRSKLLHKADWLARRTCQIFNVELLTRLILSELSAAAARDDLDEFDRPAEFRANEIAHTAVKLRMEVGLEQTNFSRLSDWLDNLEVLMRNAGAPFDAGMWLARVDVLEQAMNRKLLPHDAAADQLFDFLEHAEAAIAYDPLRQGTWASNVRHHQRRLQKRFENNASAFASQAPTVGSRMEADDA